MSHNTPGTIQKLPKAELHLHLEGSVTPKLLRHLATKYETEYMDWSVERLSDELFKYVDFAAFLDTFRVVCEHLRESRDYLVVFNRLTKSLQAQNVRYAEIIYSPSIPARFGHDGAKILAALLKRSRVVEERGGPKIRWILDCVRQWEVEEARQTAELAVKYRDRGVVALGLGGDELSRPMSDLEEVFSWAKAHELFIHVHAGETGGPDQVWDAVRILGANRVGHGIQAARDPQLMSYLREHAIGLDVCLTSNVKTGAWRHLSSNPFRLLFARGLAVSINTDDPGLFQTTLVEELARCVEVFDISTEGLHRILLQGIQSAFLPHDEKMELMQSFQNEIHNLE